MRTPTPPEAASDEPEIEVTPRGDLTPPVPVRTRAAAGSRPPGSRPRQRYNVDDDVIESGEIVERRSLVVRSKEPPADEWSDEPTEISIPAMPVQRERSWRVLWLLAAIACAGAAVALLLRAPPGAADASTLEASAVMIGTTLDGEARAATVRVEAMATSPVLRAGIETDASTLADMARDNDLVLALPRGDVLEVFQLRDGARTLMLRLPADAQPLAPPAAGTTRIEAKHHTVVVVATATVAKRGTGVAGEIVISTPVALASLARGLSEHTSGAVLQGLGEDLVLVAGGTPPNVTLPIPLTTPVTRALSLAAVAQLVTSSRTYIWACAGMSLLLLLVFAVSAIRARQLQAA